VIATLREQFEERRRKRDRSFSFRAWGRAA
jgi:hypothetical protein